MQGKRSSVGSLPDSINFEYGSSSNNIDQQICWSSLQNPTESSGSIIGTISQETRNLSRWNISEPSSSNIQNHDNSSEVVYDQIGVVSRNSVDLNFSTNQISNTISSNNGSTSSGSGGFVLEEEGNGRRLSCKRKNVEGNSGSSSSTTTSMWQALPPPINNSNGTINTSARLLGSRPEAANPRLRLSIGDLAHDNGVRTEQPSRRNYRVRVNPRIEQNSFPNQSVLTQVTEPIRYVPINAPPGEMGLQQDLNTRPVPRNLSEHPMFIPSTRNVAPSYRAGPSTGPQSSNGPTWGSHRTQSSSQYSRRLSEYVRRSLISSVPPESGLHSAHRSAPSSSSFQEVVLPAGGGAHNHGEGIPGIPYSLRGALAGGGEGRSRLVSEHIRSVLDMMRRGEGLRFEDVMLLDPSVFFGMADIHDEHRDMRLDIDNMSYEELLALEDRIGNVSTGLPEDKITARLKQKRYSKVIKEDQEEVEPCCICQEVYKNGEDMGALDCGHDFHAKCIKQWLQQKNSCPICKTTGLAT